jgi:acetoin utilization protein AcuC
VAPERYNFSDHGDNPPYEGMYEASTLSTGASLVGAELVAEGEVDVAFNVAGGLHHAARGNASGFCIFNDPVVAIEYLRRRGMRVVYVDIDCHHGDGVQAAFYGDSDVMTISMHESGHYLFPGTGEVAELGSGDGSGYSVNVPLAPYTDDDTFLWAFSEVVPPLLGVFDADILVAQLGMDTHFDDPITNLSLTVEGHGEVVRQLGALATRWLALGGGGYDVGAVARGWSLDYGIMMGTEWPDEIPERYRLKYGLDRLRDGLRPSRLETANAVRAFAEASVAEVKRAVFPLHGIA